MSQELLYTSAPQGLKPGSRGFCTVVSTQGMPSPLASALESISGYRPVFAPGDANAASNPVVYSHLHLNAAGKQYHVLSRISDYGLDYSQRANKIAHHVVLDPKELSVGGPAVLLKESGFMESAWDGKPRILPTGRSIPNTDQPPAICQTWQRLTGDAGWAGVLAESLLADPERQAYLVFQPGMNMLSLMAEAVALLPAERRWEATFNTYLTGLPPGVTCNWRCVLAGSAEANQSRRFVRALRIDLTQPLGKADGGSLVEMARTGKAPKRAGAVVPVDYELGFEDLVGPSQGPSAKRPPAPGVPDLPPPDRDDPFEVKVRPPEVSSKVKRPPGMPSRERDRDRSRFSSSRNGWLVWSIGLLLILSGGGAAAYSLLNARPNAVGKNEPDTSTAVSEPEKVLASDSTDGEKENATPEATATPPKAVVGDQGDQVTQEPMGSTEEASDQVADVGTNMSPSAGKKASPSEKAKKDAASSEPNGQESAKKDDPKPIEKAASNARDRDPNEPYYVALPKVEKQSEWVSLELPKDFELDGKATIQLVRPVVDTKKAPSWPGSVSMQNGVAVKSQITGASFGEFQTRKSSLLFRWTNVSQGLRDQSFLLQYCSLLVKTASGESKIILHKPNAHQPLLAVADEDLELQLNRDGKRTGTSLVGNSWTILGQFRTSVGPISELDYDASRQAILPKFSLRSLELESGKDGLRFTLAPAAEIDDPIERIRHFVGSEDPAKVTTVAYPIVVKGDNGQVVIMVRRDLCNTLETELRDKFLKLMKDVPEGKPSEKEASAEFKNFEKALQEDADAVGILNSELQKLKTTKWRYDSPSDEFKRVLNAAAELREAAKVLKVLQYPQALKIKSAEITYPMSWNGQKGRPVSLYYRSKPDSGSSPNMN